jgi:hypothetical protein
LVRKYLENYFKKGKTMIINKEEKETKYLLFEKQTHDDRKTYVVFVGTKERLLLGKIKWFSQWRRYAFYPTNDKVFDETCLEDIKNYIHDLMEERKTK